MTTSIWNLAAEMQRALEAQEHANLLGREIEYGLHEIEDAPAKNEEWRAEQERADELRKAVLAKARSEIIEPASPLIDAAPKLLEACKSVLSTLDLVIAMLGDKTITARITAGAFADTKSKIESALEISRGEIIEEESK